MMRTGPLRTIILVVLVVGVMSALLAPATAQQPRRGGTLRIAHIGEPPTLDQHRSPSVHVADVANFMNEGLFALNSKFEPKPMLVEKWTLENDRLTYTFTLRRGVRFHNGKDLTSEDVKASLERWGRLASRGRLLFANVASLATPDPHTVTIKLKEPYALILVDLAIDLQLAAIIPKEVAEEAGTGPLRRFIGTGPYRFVEHLPDRHIRFDRFDGYAARSEEPDGMAGRKHAYFDSIFIIPVPDVAIRMAGVTRNEYQFAKWVTPDEFDRLSRDPNLTPSVARIPWGLVGLFNHKTGLLTNLKIRQAVQAAIDHAAVLRGTFGSQRFWRLNPGMLPSEHPMWTDAGKELYNAKNVERAKQLLAEAGYKGEPLRWLATMEIAPYGTSAQLVKPMLERAGFVVDLQFLEWTTVVSRIFRTEGWDAFSTAFPPTADPTFFVALHPNGVGFYDYRDNNAFLTLLRRHTDPKTRLDIWGRMQKTWYENAGFIKYGDYFQLNLHRRELQGYTNIPTDIWWNTWWAGR